MPPGRREGAALLGGRFSAAPEVRRGGPGAAGRGGRRGPATAPGRSEGDAGLGLPAGRGWVASSSLPAGGKGCFLILIFFFFFHGGNFSMSRARPRPPRYRPPAALRAALTGGSEPSLPPDGGSARPVGSSGRDGRAARPRGGGGVGWAGSRAALSRDPRAALSWLRAAAVLGRRSGDSGSYGPGRQRGCLHPGGGKAFWLRFVKGSVSRVPTQLCEAFFCAGFAVRGSWRRCG